MNPKTVGTLAYNAANKTYASTFEIDVKYVDGTGLNDDIKQTIVVPAQKFAYQGTFWKNGKGEGVFNVNPIVLKTIATSKLTWLMALYINRPKKNQPTWPNSSSIFVSVQRLSLSLTKHV